MKVGDLGGYQHLSLGHLQMAIGGRYQLWTINCNSKFNKYLWFLTAVHGCSWLLTMVVNEHE